MKKVLEKSESDKIGNLHPLKVREGLSNKRERGGSIESREYAADNNQLNKRITGDRDILSGLIKCPICGTGLVGTLRRRKNKKAGEYKDDFYYKCLHRKKIDETHFCNFRMVLSQDEINGQVEEIILDMVADPDFKDYMVRKIDEKVDVSSLETERDQVREQLRQVMGAKKKLSDMLDQLDVNDKHYDRKYQDMHDRMDILYDRISDLEDMIADIEVKISGAYGEKITANQLYKVLLNFDKMYFKMTDLEKKQFMRDFIEEIELYPERQDDGHILKQLSLGFPVFYEGSEGDTIRLLKQNTVETVVLLSKEEIDSKKVRAGCGAEL